MTEQIDLINGGCVPVTTTVPLNIYKLAKARRIPFSLLLTEGFRTITEAGGNSAIARLKSLEDDNASLRRKLARMSEILEEMKQ